MTQQQIDFKSEFTRRHSQERDMLRAFQQFGVLTTNDLMQIGTGCSSRLKSLRRNGHKIVARYERPGMWTYTYLGTSEDGESE